MCLHGRCTAQGYKGTRPMVCETLWRLGDCMFMHALSCACKGLQFMQTRCCVLPCIAGDKPMGLL